MSASSSLAVVPRVIHLSKRSNSWVHKWSSFKRWQELEKAREEHMEEKYRLRNFIKLPTGLYITPERPEDSELSFLVFFNYEIQFCQRKIERT